MDIKVNIGAARLLYESMIQGKADCARIPYYPQKTVAFATPQPAAFARMPLCKSRFDGEGLLSLLRELSADRDAQLHSLLLLEDGKCLLEASVPGYSTRTPHITYSMCKTVTGLAVGMLMDDGLLSADDRVIDLLPESRPLLPLSRTRALTVRHLLTMSSGVAFGEAGSVVETNWRRAFLESAVRFEPGTSFSYNSMNSYMLSAIVCRLTGKSLSDFLEERLWQPLNARDVFWEKDPAGIEKGGWGLYLAPQDMAKLGQLYLDGGVYNGQRLVSEAFIRAATTAQNIVPDRVGAFDYGYQLWVAKDRRSFLFNGMLGQNVWVVPEERLVLVMTAGDSCMFQDTPSLQTAMRFFMAPAQSRRRGVSARRLHREEKNFGRAVNWIPLGRGKHAERASAADFAGRYEAGRNSATSLPYVTRLMQNNHAAGITAFAFSPGDKKNEAVLSLSEGGENHTFLLGERDYRYGTVDYRGELYRVAGAYAVGQDEDGLTILKIELKFPELATVRRMVLRRGKGGKLTLSLSETPGYALVAATAESTAAGGAAPGALLDFLTEKVDLDSFLLRAERTFRPRLTLTPVSSEGEGMEEPAEK